MSKLFLSSSFANVIDLFSEFMGELRGKKVAFIPTASKVEEVTFYVDDAKNALSNKGVDIKELDLTMATFSEIAEQLEHCDFIYISGGNTFFLLEQLKRTGADKLIMQQVNAGKLYVGESAGAMIASPNIHYVQLMDSVDSAPHLVEYDALKLVDFYPVPHYTNFPFVEAAQNIIDSYSTTLHLMPITNEQAIIVDAELVAIKTKIQG